MAGTTLLSGLDINRGKKLEFQPSLPIMENPWVYYFWKVCLMFGTRQTVGLMEWIVIFNWNSSTSGVTFTLLLMCVYSVDAVYTLPFFGKADWVNVVHPWYRVWFQLTGYIVAGCRGMPLSFYYHSSRTLVTGQLLIDRVLSLVLTCQLTWHNITVPLKFTFNSLSLSGVERTGGPWPSVSLSEK